MLWKIAIGNPPSGVSINFYEMPEALVSVPTTYLYGIQKKSLWLFCISVVTAIIEVQNVNAFVN